jgi:hypothetical protein
MMGARVWEVATESDIGIEAIAEGLEKRDAEIKAIAGDVIRGDRTKAVAGLAGLFTTVATGVPILGGGVAMALEKAFASPANALLEAQAKHWEKDRHREELVALVATEVHRVVGDVLIQLVRSHDRSAQHLELLIGDTLGQLVMGQTQLAGRLDLRFDRLETKLDGALGASSNRTEGHFRVVNTAPRPPIWFVNRPQELDTLVNLLTAERAADAGPATAAITTAFQGGGGFGKTVLAQALAHDPRMTARFPDGVLWIEIGETPNLLFLLTEQLEHLMGSRPAVSSLTQAETQFRLALSGRTVLVILDDVWNDAHARCFLQASQRGAHLVTTRSQDVAVSLLARPVQVNEMKSSEAAELLLAWLDERPPDLVPFRKLANDLGEWPLLAFSPDGKFALAASSNTLKLWNLASGHLLRTFEGQALVSAVAFSPDGKSAVSASHDKTLKLWNLASGDIIASFTGDAALSCVSVGLDGRRAVAGDVLGRVHLFEIAL